MADIDLPDALSGDAPAAAFALDSCMFAALSLPDASAHAVCAAAASLVSQQHTLLFGVLYAHYQFCTTTSASLATAPRVRRRYVGMFDERVLLHDLPNWSDELFRKRFRMTRVAFNVLHSRVEPALRRNRDGSGRPGRSVMMQLLVTLWRLSRKGESICDIGDRFNCSDGYVAVTSSRVISVIVNTLYEEYVQWPSADEQVSIIAEFANLSHNKLPGVIGCVDGTHIPLGSSIPADADYVNRKGTHSLIMQCVCDHRLVIRDVVVIGSGGVVVVVFVVVAVSVVLCRRCGGSGRHCCSSAAAKSNRRAEWRHIGAPTGAVVFKIVEEQSGPIDLSRPCIAGTYKKVKSVHEEGDIRNERRPHVQRSIRCAQLLRSLALDAVDALLDEVLHIGRVGCVELVMQHTEHCLLDIAPRRVGV